MDEDKETVAPHGIEVSNEECEIESNEVEIQTAETNDSDGVTGYITSVSEQKVSTNNNPYFDITFKSSPVLGQKIRVMADTTYNHDFFKDHLLKKSPIKFKELSPAKSGKIFFNSKTGSAATTPRTKLSFNFDEYNDIKIKDLKENPPSGTFSVTGRIEWTEAERKVPVGMFMKGVRDGKIFDQSDNINISVWEPLIQNIDQRKTYQIKDVAVNQYLGVLKVTTTMNSTVRLVEEQDIHIDPAEMQQNQIICCPDVIAVKLEEYFSCRNISCRRKILVQEKEQRFITCKSCNRKMATAKLNHTFSCDVTLEKMNHQMTLTMFPNVVETLNLDNTILDEEILNLENYDFHYSKKRIVTKVVAHTDI